MRNTVFIEKIKEEIAILIYILVTKFFTSKCVFFVAKLPYAIPNSFIIAIALSIKCYLAKSGIFLLKL